MSRKLTAARCLAVAAAIALLTATGTAVSAAPGRGDGAAAVGGLRITGTMTFSMFIPAADVVLGGDKGGETQTGTFTIDLESVDLPFNNVWVSNDSSYAFKDSVKAHQAPVPYGCPQGTWYTASGTGGGVFPQQPVLGSPNFIDAQWWYERADAQPGAPLIYVGGQAAGREGGRITNACGENAPWDRGVYEVTPACLQLPLPKFGLFATGGPFDGKNDTINLDCKGTQYGMNYDIQGTLHVDAYMFVLPRSVKTRSEWHTILFSKHHDHASIDIPVSVGTPYFAVTAGTATYTSVGNACGLGIVLHGLDGVSYTYCHGSEREVANGVTVPPGTELGLTGNTGHSTGPHLHFQITYKGTLRCPQSLLWALYDGTQPPPDAQTVHNLPTTGCTPI
jgi:hypothetical protein